MHQSTGIPLFDPTCVSGWYKSRIPEIAHYKRAVKELDQKAKSVM